LLIFKDDFDAKAFGDSLVDADVNVDVDVSKLSLALQ
jgi:hypothetical protein